MREERPTPGHLRCGWNPRRQRRQSFFFQMIMKYRFLTNCQSFESILLVRRWNLLIPIILRPQHGYAWLDRLGKSIKAFDLDRWVIVWKSQIKMHTWNPFLVHSLISFLTYFIFQKMNSFWTDTLIAFDCVECRTVRNAEAVRYHWQSNGPLLLVFTVPTAGGHVFVCVIKRKQLESVALSESGEGKKK